MRTSSWLALALLLVSPLAQAERPRGSAALRGVLSMTDAQKAALPPAMKQQAINTFGLRAVALSNDFVARHDPSYACTVPGEASKHRVRDQKRSGRCWIYATDRVLRSIITQKGVKPPEMSTSFVNYHALRNLSLGLLRKAAAGDKKALSPDAVTDASEGGYGAWGLEMVRQYGFVPKTRMDSTADAANSGLAVNELQRLLAAAQQDFGRVKKSAPDAAAQREAILKRYEGEVDQLLAVTLGAPPSSFTFRGKSYTPQSFASDYLRLKPADLDMVVLSNNPTRAFGQRRAIKDWGMEPFQVYNVAMPVLEKAVRDTVSKGQAVYLATNVSGDQPYRAEGDNIPARAKGILSMAAFNYGAFIPQHPLSKHDRLDASLSPTNHAMAITGFDPTTRGGVEKWLVENSWGRTAGAQGHWHMYEDFFRQYVTEVAVPRAMVPKVLLDKTDARAAAKAAKAKPKKQ